MVYHQIEINPDNIPWLLNHADPGVRYLALRDLLDPSDSDPELKLARRLAHTNGPIAEVLQHMDPDGYWVSLAPVTTPSIVPRSGRSSCWPSLGRGLKRTSGSNAPAAT